MNFTFIALDNTDRLCLIDKEDELKCSTFKWAITKGYVFARNSKTRRMVTLHSFILGKQDGMYIDHKNRNPLDNRKINLRVCDNSQNCHNRWKPKKSGLSSKYKGVDFHKNSKKFHASICINRNKIHLGYFIEEKDAALAYNKAAIKFLGEFTVINNIDSNG